MGSLTLKGLPSDHATHDSKGFTALRFAVLLAIVLFDEEIPSHSLWLELDYAVKTSQTCLMAAQADDSS